MVLVGRSTKSSREFIKKKTKDEQKLFLSKNLEKYSKQIDELLSGENAKQGSDWRVLENDLILKSSIVCCTLSMAGNEKLEIAKNTFDYLIVDEACQCIEPSTLIPFELAPKRVILVGD
jgi:superfamily I DNA and/or RNA helicase